MRYLLLEEINSWVKKYSSLNFKNGVEIVGLWGIKCNFQPLIKERKFVYNILVAQTLGQGACYYEGQEIPADILTNLVGSKYKCSLNRTPPIEIALMDSIAASFEIPSDSIVKLSGSCKSKSKHRAKIIADEVTALANRIQVNRQIKICNIGVVSLLINELIEQGFNITASDRDENLIGSILCNELEVQDSIYTLDLIRNADIAIVTGMTLSTNTLYEIIQTASSTKTRLIIFAETGSAFAPFYIERGVDVVISEPFPFYTFDGDTTIKIYRSNR